MTHRSCLAALLFLCALLAARAAEIVLEARQAEIEAPFDSRRGKPGSHIGLWNSTNMIARWKTEIPQKATYRVFVTLASPPANAGSTLEIRVGSQRTTCVVPDTGDWNTFRELDLGPILLRKPGSAEIAAQIIHRPRGDAMNLKRIRLVPEP